MTEETRAKESTSLIKLSVSAWRTARRSGEGRVVAALAAFFAWKDGRA